MGDDLPEDGRRRVGVWRLADSTVPIGSTLVVRSIGGVSISGTVGDVFADGRDLRILEGKRSNRRQR